MAGRMSEYGTTPNKAAALGENIILLANLAWSAWLLLAFLRRHERFAALERWQTGYLPVFAAWAWIVVLAFPPLMGWLAPHGEFGGAFSAAREAVSLPGLALMAGAGLLAAWWLRLKGWSILGGTAARSLP